MGRDPEIIGRAIEVGRGSYTVIGIAPPGFTGAELAPVDIWLPLLEATAGGNVMRRDFASVQAVARLAPGRTVEVAESEATARHRIGRAELIASGSYPSDAAVLAAPVIAARGPTPTSQSRVARWLAGVSLIVLLIACLNVANLHFARSVRTRRQVAIRASLGIGRGRLLGELVAESLMVAALAAGASFLVLRTLARTVHEALLPNVAAGGTLEARTASYTLVATLAAGLLLGGLTPALHIIKVPLADALRSGNQIASWSKTRGVLLVGQVALSALLLVGAGLFVRSVRAAETLDIGFESRNLAVASLEFTGGADLRERQDIYERAMEGLERLPGVRHTALTFTVPFRSTVAIGVRAPGVGAPEEHAGFLNKVTSGYFEAMGLAVVEGRVFEPQDDAEDARPSP